MTSPPEVVRALVTYTDWWQPRTTSMLQVGAARRNPSLSDGIPEGLLETLDERTELCRRMVHVRRSDRLLLFLWYVRQLAVEDVAKAIGVSRRQCFRRRAQAIRTIVRLGEDDPAAAKEHA